LSYQRRNIQDQGSTNTVIENAKRLIQNGAIKLVMEH